MYTARANLKTLIISKGIGILQKVNKIDNYYGLESSVTGEELQEIGINQAKKLGVQFEEDEVFARPYQNPDQ